LGELGQGIGTGVLSAEQQAEMGKLQTRIALGTKLSAALLLIAAAAMSIARYL
jgi:hypothetical protein